MTNITIKTLPNKRQLSAIERFLFWRKTYFLTFGIISSLLIAVILSFRTGRLELGIKIASGLYLAFAFLLIIMKWKTTKADNQFLLDQGLPKQKQPIWITIITIIMYIIWSYIILLAYFTFISF